MARWPDSTIRSRGYSETVSVVDGENGKGRSAGKMEAGLRAELGGLQRMVQDLLPALRAHSRGETDAPVLHQAEGNPLALAGEDALELVALKCYRESPQS